jgi:hypothetical protein
MGRDLIDTRGDGASKIHDCDAVSDQFSGVNSVSFRIERDPMVHRNALAVVEPADAPNLFAISGEEP